MSPLPGRTDSRWFRACRFSWWAVLLLAAMSSRPALGADDLPREYRIKAAYLYNLIKFITWPDETTLDSDSPLNLCVYGYNPFGTYLEKLEQRSVRNHPLKVRYIAERQSSSGCHLLFISRYNTVAPPELGASAENQVSDTATARQPALLTVSDNADFLRHGGLIALVDIGNNIHLDINLTRARKLDLQFSANLLEIARRLE